jgi:hypothetical protein
MRILLEETLGQNWVWLGILANRIDLLKIEN